MRAELRQLFVDTLGDLDVDSALGPHLERPERIGAARALLVIAFGKAARPMATTLLRRCPNTPTRGLLVPPVGDDAALAPLEVIPGGHPSPTTDSLRAAARALSLCHAAGPDDDLVFLVSGGGSAMLELPADPRTSAAELSRFYQALVGCGADIRAVNTVRRHLSATKGGRLALAGRGARRQHTFAISDVPGNDEAALASGPTVAEPTTIDDCRAVLRRYGLIDRVPPALRARLDRDELPPFLRADDPLCAASRFTVVLDNGVARERLRIRAERLSMHVVEDQSVDDLPCATAAVRLLDRLAALQSEFPDRTNAVLTGGEVTIELRDDPGIGGRNQQFVLECARRIAGRPITVLSAGTDGIDGNSPAAGAVADGSTVERARALGLDVEQALQRQDAHALLRTLGDTVTTGPSGQNVRDLRLLVATP